MAFFFESFVDALKGCVELFAVLRLLLDFSSEYSDPDLFVDFVSRMNSSAVGLSRGKFSFLLLILRKDAQKTV